MADDPVDDLKDTVTVAPRLQAPLRAPLVDLAEFRRRKLRAQPRPIWVPLVVISAAVLGYVFGRLGGDHLSQASQASQD